ncbi:DIRP Myb-like DNA-binding domain [Euphorbia peplus]|nr:DIRP Myb-like DNA-binding domain [Euphorbia peplus]
MAPARKKSVNKRFLNEVSPEKEVRNSNKNKERVIGKRRLFDKLGPRWSDGELQRFYKAYRVHGVDLKKIAAEVPNRSVEMVQALYRMNKVYLSLPEGTASVVGLIAMMTDHYSTLEVSDGERESYDVLEMPRKPQKTQRAKSKLSMSKEDLLQSRSIASSDGYLSLLKKGHFFGGQPRAVGKRTPRVPISREYVSMLKGQKSENDANEEEVAHVAALALTEGLMRGGSPQVSHISRRRTEDIKSSSIRSSDKLASKIMQPKSSRSKVYDASIHGEWEEGGCRKGASNGVHTRDVSTSPYMEGFGTVEVHQKRKKVYGNKVRVEEIPTCQSDDGGEACSGTEGQKVGARKRNDIGESNAVIDETSQQDQKKRSDTNFSGDEFFALDALHALANISVMESESSVQLNEERTSLNMDDKYTIPEATSTSHHKDRIKFVGQKGKVRNAINEVEHTSSRKPKLGRHMEVYAKSTSEVKPHPQSTINNSNSNNSALKRKRQSMVPKVANDEGAINSHHGEQLKAEVEEEEIVSALKAKRICQSSAVSKQVKEVGVSEGYCTGGGKDCASEVVKSTAEVPISSNVCLPMRKTSRRKIGLKKALLSKEGSSYGNILKNQDKIYSNAVQDTPLLPKEKLSCSLSSPMVRRWCTFEWFYSAIDYPWFAKREFVEYLNHVGLGHMPTLTRVEWGVIRSSLGKPRRFSENFLLEEREKLKLYRDSVRNHYTELRTGIREGLPTDLARPLTVGQRVIALHPRTRELKDGSVLTVDHDCCRVQFDSPEMGVEIVKDIDCMPLNPFYNMPESLRRRRLPFISNEVQVNGNLNIGGCTTSRYLENSQTATVQQIATSQPFAQEQLQIKEADIQAVAELNRASDMKNSSGLPNLRKHGSYSKIVLPPWLKPAANCSSSGMLNPAPNSSSSGTFLSYHDSLVSKESESTVIEIVRDSKQRAQTMIDTAVQAISLMKEGEDAFVKIGEAFDSVEKIRLPAERKVQVIRSPEQSSHHNPLMSSSFESEIPSELITSCVATLLMIQTCTERQYPPAEVAQIIDSAVMSMHPCCSQNLPIYREIQMCMGRIKTQILALIPT